MIGGKQIIGTGKKIGKRAGKIAGVGIGGAALVGGASLLTGKGLRGTGKAMRKAFAGGFKGDKFSKKFASSYGAGAARKREVKKMRNDGVSPGRVSRENFKNMFRGMTAKDKYEDFSNSMKSIQDGYKSYYNGVTGSDAVAKSLEKRRVAAESRGDSEAAARLENAIDERMKMIQSNGHKVAESNSDSGKSMIDAFASDIEAGRNTMSDYGSVSSTFDLSEKESSGLANISSNVGKTIEHVNDKYTGSYDYDGGLSAGDDLKKTNGKTKGVMLDAENSQEAKNIQDVYKYVKTDSKK